MKKLKLEYGDSVFSLPRENLMTALSQASEQHLKVLLVIASDDSLRMDYSAMCASVCKKLDCTQTALERSLKFWSETGVVRIMETADITNPTVTAKPVVTQQSPTLPSYSEGAAADIMQKNPELSGVIEMCQQIIGKIFTPAEVEIVVGLYDHLRLDAEYIVTLVAYCNGNGKKSLRYIEKTALNLYDEGIDSTEALKDYIRRRETRDDDMSKIRTIIGAGARQFTSKEKKAFDCWLDEWKFDIDVITRAYEVTIDNINEVSVPYMNRVLENWHKSGLTTIKAVEESLAAYKKNKAEAENSHSGFATDEFFEAALKRSEKYYAD